MAILIANNLRESTILQVYPCRFVFRKYVMLNSQYCKRRGDSDETINHEIISFLFYYNLIIIFNIVNVHSKVIL
jgi:hypothetical protein